jgi:hypothetical protein
VRVRKKLPGAEWPHLLQVRIYFTRAQRSIQFFIAIIFYIEFLMKIDMLQTCSFIGQKNKWKKNFFSWEQKVHSSNKIKMT